MTPSDPPPLLGKIGSAALVLAFHTLVALLFVSVISIVVIGTAANVLASLPHKDIFAECFVFVIGLGVGFVANRASLKRVACWVWIPGLTWLAFGIWDSARDFDPRSSQGCSAVQYIVNSFFVLDSSKCNGGEGAGLSGLFFTLPAFCSVAYSVGAWIALMVGRRDRNTTASIHST
ncbi:MAG: hypothetical protein WAM04_23135 [Candidatus Sulfotelmatobacter sp.]